MKEPAILHFSYLLQIVQTDTEENNQPIKLEQEVLSDNKLKAQYLEIRELIKQEIIVSKNYVCA